MSKGLLNGMDMENERFAAPRSYRWLKAELPASRTSKVRCCESCSWASPRRPYQCGAKPGRIGFLAYSCHIRRSDSGAIRLVASSPWVSSSSQQPSLKRILSSPKHVSSALQGVRGLREEITALTERRLYASCLSATRTPRRAHIRIPTALRCQDNGT